jgi:predicted DsbA family dithiol-disulfide isomerase
VYDAAVTWLPFDLHPEYPPDGLPRERLLARYGPEMTERVGSFFAARGLEYRPHPDVVPNSRAALRLAELARELGVHDRFHDDVMQAYWHESRDIGDHAVLRELAAASGLPDGEVDAVVGSDRYLGEVEDSTRRAVSIGANAVPAFLLDGRLLVLGAQPDEVLDAAVDRVSARTRAMD